MLVTIVGWIIVMSGISCQRQDDNHTPKGKKKENESNSSGAFNNAASSKEVDQMTRRDVSQMDMSYCPFDYPLLKMQGKIGKEPLARVIYGRPHKKGRVIFGKDSSSLCRFGMPWRMGANEATEIEFFSDATFNHIPVKKGKYVIYCIPDENAWNIRLNSNCYSWGLQMDSSLDVLKTNVPINRSDKTWEDLTIFFHSSHSIHESYKEYLMVIAWDQTSVSIPIAWLN